jgi:hypothetical protein
VRERERETREEKRQLNKESAVRTMHYFPENIIQMVLPFNKRSKKQY